MITEAQRFPIFIMLSLVVFVIILRYVTRNRFTRPPVLGICVVAAIVVVGGMLFAKFTQNHGWPWWIYYAVPALVTLILPPLAFRFSMRELWQYLVLAFLSSPAIHVLFSFLLGWHDYMPVFYIPYWHELLSHSRAGS